jgi:lysophospholipase
MAVTPEPAKDPAASAAETAKPVAKANRWIDMPPARLVAHARNPVPIGARVGYFKGFDDAPLRYALWPANRAPRRGTVCLFGGRGEFIEKYFETIADLQRRGFSVATMDFRGQGGSARELVNRRAGHVRDFTEHDRDLTRFMRDIVLPDCPPPYIALGHSTGGNIILRQATAQNSWFDRMIVSAPLLHFAPASLPFSEDWVGRLSTLACLLGQGHRYARGKSDDNFFEHMPFENNGLTSDRERFTRNLDVLKLAPELATGGPTFAWMRATCRSMQLLAHPGFPERVRVPLLLVAAGADQVVSSLAIEELARRLKVGSHVIIPGSQHEILQERDELRSQFWAVFDGYVMGERGAA